MSYQDPYHQRQGLPGTPQLPAPYAAAPPVHWPPAVVVAAPKSTGAAIALELILGIFGIFGVGSIYAGRVVTGIVLMVSFWVLFWINFALIFLAVGLVTMPLTWLAYLAGGAVLAARAVDQHNLRAIGA
ncbi:hypothetical protein [Micromonospora sp. WMMD1082]|uniref:hypothetical protein n=1 Tax=Micromonospora sp. WMMD1082 TaxID=3016104 RepID=UPI0024161DCD|nr:hypothetical protein [Micromonospora sp. WMMD1082]MDG4797575.1 hypothetical protein [Micromonospora sp. WMMD1082]